MAIRRPTRLTPQQDKQRAAAIRQSQIETNAGIKSSVNPSLVGAKPGVVTRSGNTLFKNGKLMGNYNSKEAADAAFSEFTGTGSNVAGDTGGKTYRYIQKYGVGDKTNPSMPYYGQFQSPTASPARTPFKVNALNSGVSGNQMQGNPYDTSRMYSGYNAGALSGMYGSQQADSLTSDSQYMTGAPEKPKTLAEIRADQLAQAQSSIDATQAIFEDTLRSIRQTGKSQLAQASSQNVSAGLAGSPFAQTNETGVQNYTQEQLNARANQRAADIASIRQTAEANAQNLYQQGIQNYQTDREFYVSERDKQIEAQKALAEADKKSATDTLTTLAKSGYSIDEMKPEEYKALLAKSGISDFEARAIWAASSPKANAKYEIKNGFIVGTYFDPHTGLPVVTTTALPDALKDKAEAKLKTEIIGGKMYVYDEADPKFDENGNLVLSKAVVDGSQLEDTEADKVLSPTEAAALGVPYGTTQKEAADMGIDMSLGGLTTQQRTYLNQIQDNARQDPNISTFDEVRASYETARSAALKADGAGDIVLMRMIAKITDPTTGVREEEFKTFSDAQGTLARYGVTLTKKMWSGGRLTEEGRAALLSQAEDIYSQRKSAYDDSVNFFDKQAVEAGLPSGLVSPYYTAPEADSEQIRFNKSYSNVDSITSEYPELQSAVDSLRSDYSDDEILQYLEGKYGAGGTSFKSDASTSLNSSPNASALGKLATVYAPGTTGGQCGHFVNKHTGFRVGDSYASKMAITDPTIGKKNNPPKAGDVFVFPYKSTGHIGFISSVQPLEDGTYKLGIIDSNYSLDEKVKHHYINSKIVTGYARPKQIIA